MGKNAIELIINKKYKYWATALCIIISLFYILNVNNHYDIFLNEDRILRGRIKELERINTIFNRFTYKITDMALYNNKSFASYQEAGLNSDHYKIAYVFGSDASEMANRNLLRLTNSITNYKKDIELINLSEAYRNSNAAAQGALCFLLDNNNDLSAALALDGYESREEMQLIINYLLAAAERR